MTDVNAMTRIELEAQADILGIPFATNIGDDKLRNRIKEALGEVVEEAPKAVATRPGKKNEAMYKVTIHPKEGDDSPVPIGVNGVINLVKRGHEVLLSERYVTVLRNANRLIQDQTTKEWKSVPAYPYQAEKVS